MLMAVSRKQRDQDQDRLGFNSAAAMWISMSTVTLFLSAFRMAAFPLFAYAQPATL